MELKEEDHKLQILKVKNVRSIASRYEMLDRYKERYK